ncbi:GNAT family N-acetyltransferase [Streptomyces sp. NA04227]|uniref:GNAT family N-acetyltransferase n=1 Tax=Streptomyces sp. NA04227 TaxID=2742136 RepID=UPI0015911683|nr:N-acetyltransferase [Streptomyces sp. NA04227]QKW08135.1 GNAT family N-acetyltransferase [Streptomyces sp. NA04227]
MDHVIRRVRAEEWVAVRELRLAALLDPAAPIAFLDTYEQAVARPDEFWQERTERAAEGVAAAQFVAETPDGGWDGSVTVIVEEPGGKDYFGQVIEARQVHLVGVFVRPEQRGRGVTEALFEAAVDWAWSAAGVSRARLFVHRDNPRAEGFYRRFGFVPTGVLAPEADGPEREFVLDH